MEQVKPCGKRKARATCVKINSLAVPPQLAAGNQAAGNSNLAMAAPRQPAGAGKRKPVAEDGTHKPAAGAEAVGSPQAQAPR